MKLESLLTYRTTYVGTGPSHNRLDPTILNKEGISYTVMPTEKFDELVKLAVLGKVYCLREGLEPTTNNKKEKTK